MELVLDWAGLCLLAAAGAAVLWVLGWLAASLLGMRAIPAFVFALPIGSGVFGALSLGWGFAGLSWTWLPVLGLALVLLVGHLARLYWHRRQLRQEVSAGGSRTLTVRNQNRSQGNTQRRVAGKQTTVVRDQTLDPLDAVNAFAWQRGTVVLLLVSMCGFAAFQLVVFAYGAKETTTLPIWGDAQFHLSALQLIYESRDVNPIQALIPLYGWEKDTSSYYPVGWHALTVLFMFSDDPVFANNAMSLMIGAILWPVNLSALGIAVYPRASRWMALIVPLVAVPFVVFPAVICYSNATYPFAMAVALLPGVLGMMLFWQRHRCLGLSGEACRSWRWGIGLALIGSVCLQPSITVSLLLAGVAVGVVQLIGALPAWYRQGGAARARAFWLPALVVVAVGVVAFILPHVSYVQKLGEFEKPVVGIKTALAGLWNGSFAITVSWMPWKFFFLAALVGAIWSVWLVRKRASARRLFVSQRDTNHQDDSSIQSSISCQSQVVASQSYASSQNYASLQRRATSRVSWTLLLIFLGWGTLYLGACGEESYLRLLTGPWYKDDLRLSVPLLAIVAVWIGLVASKILELCQIYLKRRHANANWSWYWFEGVYCLLAVAVAAGLFTSDRYALADYVKVGYKMAETGTSQLDQDEMRLLAQLDDYLEEGSKVFGDPEAGVGYADLLSEHESYVGLPTILQNLSLDQWRLMEYFQEWETNEYVCQIIRDNNIEGLVVNRIVREEREDTYGTLLLTDLSAGGFELVAEEGNAQLWRITGCN